MDKLKQYPNKTFNLCDDQFDDLGEVLHVCAEQEHKPPLNPSEIDYEKLNAIIKYLEEPDLEFEEYFTKCLARLRVQSAADAIISEVSNVAAATSAIGPIYYAGVGEDDTQQQQKQQLQLQATIPEVQQQQLEDEQQLQLQANVSKVQQQPQQQQQLLLLESKQPLQLQPIVSEQQQWQSEQQPQFQSIDSEEQLQQYLPSEPQLQLQAIVSEVQDENGTAEEQDEANVTVTPKYSSNMDLVEWTKCSLQL